MQNPIFSKPAQTMSACEAPVCNRPQRLASRELRDHEGSGEEMPVISHGNFPVGRRSRGAPTYLGLAGAAPCLKTASLATDSNREPDERCETRSRRFASSAVSDHVAFPGFGGSGWSFITPLSASNSGSLWTNTASSRIAVAATKESANERRCAALSLAAALHSASSE